MSEELVIANGVNGLTGEYLFEQTELSDLALAIRGGKQDKDVAGSITAVLDSQQGDHLGLPFNVDPDDPSKAGWGVVFAADESPEVRAALRTLIDHRIDQFGPDAVKELEYQDEESWGDWLARHGVAPGGLNPKRVPYYLLLVGGPDRIPFQFQYLLAVEYAVGRLDFDLAGEFVRYGESVISLESDQAAPRRRSVAFFGTKHPNDRATELSAEKLLTPLVDGDQAAGRPAVSEFVGFDSSVFVGDSATKGALDDLFLGRGETSRNALLFTATHGLGGWPAGHEEQQAKHGALVCQDWSGIGRIEPSDYYSASDLPADADIHGMVAFFFACYGAGTPRYDDFVLGSGESAPMIADPPFVARLPKSMLSHPGGGAIAVVGHVERAWGYSFLSGAGSLLVPFENALARIIDGRPIGLAMVDFTQRYAALSAAIASLLHDISFGKQVLDSELVELWTERNDAQNFVLIGDPVVRLRVEEQTEPT